MGLKHGYIRKFFLSEKGFTMSRDMLFSVVLMVLLIAVSLAILAYLVKPAIYRGLSLLP